MRIFFDPTNTKKMDILDYGSGESKSFDFVFKNDPVQVFTYDKYFYPIKPTKSFDLIILNEVIEHFKNPSKELEELFTYLNKEGFIFIRTCLRSANLEFKNWWYPKDFTHVAFYSEKTFKFIQEKYNLNQLSIKGDLILMH